MGKKHTGKNAGNHEKAEFQIFRQGPDMSCGAACLQMIEQWATGSHQDKAYWCLVAGMTEKGISPAGMQKALGKLRLDVKPLHEAKIKGWREGSIALSIDSTTIYLLAMDSYGDEGSNLGHWILLLDTFWSIEKLRIRKRSNQLLALYADPLEDDLVVWPWTSLLHAEVYGGFCLTKKLD